MGAVLEIQNLLNVPGSLQTGATPPWSCCSSSHRDRRVHGVYRALTRCRISHLPARCRMPAERLQRRESAPLSAEVSSSRRRRGPMRSKERRC